jgi:hypothetical protein
MIASRPTTACMSDVESTVALKTAARNVVRRATT